MMHRNDGRVDTGKGDGADVIRSDVTRFLDLVQDVLQRLEPEVGVALSPARLGVDRKVFAAGFRDHLAIRVEQVSKHTLRAHVDPDVMLHPPCFPSR